METWSLCGSCLKVSSLDVQQENFAYKYLLWHFWYTHPKRRLQNTWLKIIFQWEIQYIFCYRNLLYFLCLTALLLVIEKTVTCLKIKNFLCKNGWFKNKPWGFSTILIKLLVAKIHAVNIISPRHAICGPSGYREFIWTFGRFSVTWTCPTLHAQGLALGTCCCTNITSFIALTLSHSWALLSITQRQRDRGDTELVATPVCWQHCWLNWFCCPPAVSSHLFWRTNIYFAPWWPG